MKDLILNTFNERINEKFKSTILKYDMNNGVKLHSFAIFWFIKIMNF